MDAGNYFFEQTSFRSFPKRGKKHPDEQPSGLRFSHLNPKTAAFLASQEKTKTDELSAEKVDDQKQKNNESLASGAEQKPLCSTAGAVKLPLEPTLSFEDDSQRYLFDSARQSAENVLQQLSRFIYSYSNIAAHIPKSLEHQMMSSFSELTADVLVVAREWQTKVGRDALPQEGGFNSGQEKLVEKAASSDNEGRVTNILPQTNDPGQRKKQHSPRLGALLPQVMVSDEAPAGSLLNTKVQDARFSMTPRHSVQGQSHPMGKFLGVKKRHRDVDGASFITEAASENPSMTPSHYMPVIQFQLSSKVCEERGWICLKGQGDGPSREAILELCLQKLHQQLKMIKEQTTLDNQMGLTLPVVVRCYGDTHKEAVQKYCQISNKVSPGILLKNGKPRIPSLSQIYGENEQIMLTSHKDGTTVSYYPSGQPAVVASAAGPGQSGFYTLVYDDLPGKRMLAVFTPVGRGVCYHTNGNVRYLSTRKGGHLANEDGKIIRHWKWPASSVRLSSAVQFQINQHLNFRCSAENHTFITFSCQKESARFALHASPGLSAQRKGDNDQLLTDYKFISNAAKGLPRTQASKPRTKIRKDKLTKQLVEMVKSVDSMDRLVYESEAEKEHARLLQKARNLVDDWLEHYRIHIGLKSPTLAQLSDSPLRGHARISSAKTAEVKEDRGDAIGLRFNDLVVRKLSAPSGSPFSKFKDAIADFDPPTADTKTTASVVKLKQLANKGQKEGEIPKIAVSPFTAAFNEKVSQILETKKKSRSAPTKSSAQHQLASVALQGKENILGEMSSCPVALRKQLLTSSASSHCRCSRDFVPYISDVEYDVYVSAAAPSAQLQVIAVVSSLQSETTIVEDMLHQIYQRQNCNRTRPCDQCRADTFRLLRYDVDTAAEGSGHEVPYLLTQHNVAPGMFLIYAGGRLVFCDHIFNGYGSAKRDFQKQVIKTKSDFLQGLSLPKDFRFSPSKGLRGLRSPWGGDISGSDFDNFNHPDTDLVGCMVKEVKLHDSTQIDSGNIKKRIPKLPELSALPSQNIPPRKNIPEEMARTASVRVMESQKDWSVPKVKMKTALGLRN